MKEQEKYVELEEMTKLFYDLHYDIMNIKSWDSNDKQQEKKELKKQLSKARRILKKIAPAFEEGKSYTAREALVMLNICTFSKSPKKKFLREDGSHYSDKELEIISEAIQDRTKYQDNQCISQGWYDYFNKESSPLEVKVTVIDHVKEEVDSNNIYELMAAPQKTQYRVEFQIKVPSSNNPYSRIPVTIYREFWKDTTLSQRDINSFM